MQKPYAGGSPLKGHHYHIEDNKLYHGFMTVFSRKSTDLWTTIIASSMTDWELDDQSIIKMLQSYDLNSQTFGVVCLVNNNQ
jgi:hypothetical protein